MHLFLITILLIVQTINIYASDVVLVNTPYNVETGSFMLLEVQKNAMILNEYPAFYSEKVIPQDSSVTCIDNQGGVDYACGHTIGSYKNFYPVVPFKNVMMCGRHNLKQFNNRSLSYNNLWWKTTEDFYQDTTTSNIPIINTYLSMKEICFVYHNNN